MTSTLTISHITLFVVALETALLGVVGMLHLVQPAHLEQAAARHRAVRAVPNWLGALERPRPVGVLEVVLALAVVAAYAAGPIGVQIAVQTSIGLFALGLLAFVSVLRRSPAALPCGCHPFAGEVRGATFAPAGVLFAAALVGGIGAPLEPAVPGSYTVRLAVVVLAALTAGAVLVFAGAASEPSAEPVEASR